MSIVEMPGPDSSSFRKRSAMSYPPPSAFTNESSGGGWNREWTETAPVSTCLPPEGSGSVAGFGTSTAGMTLGRYAPAKETPFMTYGLNSDPYSTQCAAVKTTLGRISVPPQMDHPSTVGEET